MLLRTIVLPSNQEIAEAVEAGIIEYIAFEASQQQNMLSQLFSEDYHRISFNLRVYVDKIKELSTPSFLVKLYDSKKLVESEKLRECVVNALVIAIRAANRAPVTTKYGTCVLYQPKANVTLRQTIEECDTYLKNSKEIGTSKSNLKR